MEKRTPDNTKIKMYTTSWCGPCKMAKKLLTDKGYNFEELRISKYDGHPNSLAHSIIAENMSKYFVESTN
mgnify:CR=1 FL=1